MPPATKCASIVSLAGDEPPAFPPAGIDPEEETHTALPTMRPGSGGQPAAPARDDDFDNFRPGAKTLLTPMDDAEDEAAASPARPPQGLPPDASGVHEVEPEHIVAERGRTTRVPLEELVASAAALPADAQTLPPPPGAGPASLLGGRAFEDDEDDTDTALTGPPSDLGAPAPPAPPAAVNADAPLPPTAVDPDPAPPPAAAAPPDDDVHRRPTEALALDDDASALSLAGAHVPLPDPEAAALLTEGTDPVRAQSPTSATEPDAVVDELAGGERGPPTAARVSPTYANLVVDETDVGGVQIRRWQVKPSETPSRPVEAPAAHVPAPLIRTRLQTVLFQAEDEPLEIPDLPPPPEDLPSASDWTPPPTTQAADDDDLRLAVQYLREALDELDELMPFSTQLSNESKRGFQAGIQGCGQKLRRALALLPADDDTDT